MEKRRKRKHRYLTGEDIDMFKEREYETKRKKNFQYVVLILMEHNFLSFVV